MTFDRIPTPKRVPLPPEAPLPGPVGYHDAYWNLKQQRWRCRHCGSSLPEQVEARCPLSAIARAGIEAVKW